LKHAIQAFYSLMMVWFCSAGLVYAQPISAPSQAEIISRLQPVPDYNPLLNFTYPVWVAWGQPEKYRLIDVQRTWLPNPNRIAASWQYLLLYQVSQERSIGLASHPTSDISPDAQILAYALLPTGEKITIYKTPTGGLRSSVWGQSPGYFFESPAPQKPGLISPGRQTISLQEALDFVACLTLLDKTKLSP
jgi:hypothetical protein